MDCVIPKVCNLSSFFYYYIQVDFRCWNSSEAVTNPMRDEGLSLDEQGERMHRSYSFNPTIHYWVPPKNLFGKTAEI